MAKCDICGKGVQFGHNVSHSNIKTKRKWKANIRKIKCLVKGAAKRQNVCTVCMKSGRVERA
jgi:large subunit ribosomal protein L28